MQPNLNKREIDLLKRFREASRADQDFLIVQSHFLAGKGWSPEMATFLSAVAALCVSDDRQAA